MLGDDSLDYRSGERLQGITASQLVQFSDWLADLRCSQGCLEL
jgi:hypothetical protein